jgi:hypothetical protein
MLRVLTLLLLAVGLSGCADFKSKTSAAMADMWPGFMGGLPPDAPPRPSDPRYPQFVKSEEQKLARAKTAKESEQKPPAEPETTKQP